MRHVPWLNLKPPLHCKIPSIVRPMWCRLSYTCLLLAQGLGPYPRPMQHAPSSSPSWTQSPRILKSIPTKRKRKKSTCQLSWEKKIKVMRKNQFHFQQKKLHLWSCDQVLPASFPTFLERKQALGDFFLICFFEFMNKWLAFSHQVHASKCKREDLCERLSP